MPNANRRAWNNRVRRHLDLLTRCPKCDDQELPCPRPEVKIIQVGDDEFLVKYRWFNVPTRRPATKWIYLARNGEPVRLPSAKLPAFNNWSTTWDALHVEP